MTARRTFARACVVGGAIGTILFAWMLTRGSFDFFEWQRVGDFYDAQAHAFLGGRLAVDGRLLGVEAFTVDGNAYMYQGPVPALLRLPIILITGNDLDGRLTQPSMLAAFLVALVFACRLHWKVRMALRGDEPVTRTEAWLVGLFTFVLAGGSVLLFEASRAWVYHEALLWGTAFALASIDTMVSFVRRPAVRTLALCSAFAAGALLTRASIGFGPVLGLGLLVLGAVVLRLRERSSPTGPSTETIGRRALSRLVWLAPGPRDDSTSRRFPVSILAAAALAPVGLYAVVNYAKFGRLFSVPFSAQQFSQVDPGRQRFLAENDGTLFGLQFVPSTALQYLRPDALSFTSTFPFVDFASFPGTIIGNVRFDLFDRTSSLPAAVPFLVVLAVAGLVCFVRPRSWKRRELDEIRVPFVAAVACAVTILPFGYIANRYLADSLPLLVLAGAVGLQVLARRLRDGGSVRWARAVAIALVPVAAFTLWVNVALALRYQRAWSYNLDPAVIAGFVGFQRDVNDALGGDALTIEQGTALPPGVGRPGALFALGDCDGLYLSDGLEVNTFKESPWNGVERTAAAGHFVVRLTFPPRPVGTRVPIFTNGPEDAPNILVAEYRAGSSMLFEYREPGSRYAHRYLPVTIDLDREYSVDIAADWRVKLLTVRLDDVVVLDARYLYKGDNFALGRNDGVAGVTRRFPGELTREPTGAPLCRDLVRAAREEG